MKTNLFQKALLALLFLSIVSACKKDDNPANPGGGGATGEGSFTINGAGINNRTYNVLPQIPGTPFNNFALGFYNTNDTATYVSNTGTASGDTTSVRVLIGFRGNQAGNFQTNAVPRIIQVVVGERSFVAGFESSGIGSAIISGTTFNLNVTRYDAVGGRIQGSYTGTLREASVKGGLGNATITITGNFNVVRLTDDFDGGGGGGNRTIRPFAYNPFAYKQIQE